jgi:hypothetical protein
MTGQSQFAKRLDAYWEKHGGNAVPAPAPSAKKNPIGITLAGLNISAAAEAQVTLFRAEASQPDTSPAGRGRLAKASLKAMGCMTCFPVPARPAQNNLHLLCKVGVGAAASFFSRRHRLIIFMSDPYPNFLPEKQIQFERLAFGAKLVVGACRRFFSLASADRLIFAEPLQLCP